MTDMLAGVRVLSLTTGVAGPRAGRSLAQWGAEVIKLESRNGGLDDFRFFSGQQARHARGAPDDLDHSTRFVECNLNVRSVTLDLKRPQGVALALEIATRSDIVLENYRPGVLARLGLGYEAIHEVNPGAIVLSMPGLGSAGSKSQFGSWGPSLAAFGGLTALWNHPGAPEPVGSQSVYPDYVAAVIAPAVAIACLLRRECDGTGMRVDLAQVEALGYVLGATLLGAELAVPTGALGNRSRDAAPSGVYPCAGEDAWCAVVAGSDAQWTALCQVIGRPELAADPVYATVADRCRRADDLDRAIADWTAGIDKHEVMTRLQAAGVAAGAVQTAADLCADPQLQELGLVKPVDQPGLGAVPLPDVPVLVEGGGLRQPAPAPALGQDNDYVLCDLLGHTRQEVGRWIQDLVVW